MKYEELAALGRHELERGLSSADEGVVVLALLRMALHESDWQWAEKRCLTSLKDNRRGVKTAAIQALGHLARIHGQLTLPLVLSELRAIQLEPDFSGIAEDTLDDIRAFVAQECDCENE